MRSITFVVAGVLLVGAAGCQRQAVQGVVFTEVAQRMNSVERFVGDTRVRTTQGNAEAVRVEIRNWTFGGGLKLDELPVPAKGLLIAQLRGGRVRTVIGGSRQARQEGEFWTVLPGVRMGLETDDDSASIQTIVIVRP